MNNTHSKIVGYLLWIFGFTGAHRFYYGKPLTGTLWLCTLGLLGVGWLIDFFLIPGMDAAADRRYKQGELDYNIGWLLLLFFGIFGAHRFYMGKWFTGLMFLLVTLSIGAGAFIFLILPIIIIYPVVMVLILFDFWTLNGQIDAINRGV